MAVSKVLRFARRHARSLCCLLLVLLPPVRRVLLFFSPLLASTALCVLALLSWGPSSEQKKRDEYIKMDEWAAVSSELECNEACSNAENLEESRAQESVEEQPDNPREKLLEDKALAASVECESKPAEEPDPDLKQAEARSGGGVGVGPEELPIKRKLHAQQPLQKREEEGLIMPAPNGAGEKILQCVDAKLQKTVENELNVRLEASLWSVEGAMEERLGSLGDAAMEDRSPKNCPQSKNVIRSLPSPPFFLKTCTKKT